MTVKPFYKTSEFYGALVVAVGNVIFAIADKLPPQYASVASAVVIGLYAVGRGLAKRPAASSPAPPAPPAPPAV